MAKVVLASNGDEDEAEDAAAPINKPKRNPIVQVPFRILVTATGPY
jgi:hypothetical protein